MLSVDLLDKYLATSGRVFVSGSQALVRLPLDQARLDAARGFNTAGFISGYRGSPLGVYDSALWQAEKLLYENKIHFQPGINEDLAAAAVWGTQQVPLIGTARYDGVFSMWYGKGPGVDRSADALKHGNFAGTSPKGGVVVLCGDDHAARSSTVAHQSDHALIHCGIPVLNPVDIQDYLDLGLMAFELSRYSGCWIGFKCVTDTVDGSASVRVDQDRIVFRTPDDFEFPPDGLTIRIEVAALKQEARLFEKRLEAAKAFVRANQIDRQTMGPAGRKRLGIVATGKAWRDVVEAMNRLGVSPDEASRLGIGVWRTAMVWPLEPERIRSYAEQCDELLVIEEKRGLIEDQLAALLYNLPADRRPRLVGKHDETGAPFLSEVGELHPDQVLEAIVRRYSSLEPSDELAKRYQGVRQLSGEPEASVPVAVRSAAFCAGCPHNTSTVVPDGSMAVAGIGCHGLAGLMPERHTITGYHMGAEGAPWIGQAPFVEMPHIFQNLGDGTYFHSGLLAIRACVAANVNITYKILLNGAVGMTGGQPIEGEEFAGEVTAPHVANQVRSEGVSRIAIVSDDPAKFSGLKEQFPPGVTFSHRDLLDEVQRELREHKGVSVLIYDQSCATERRRLRKRGKLPDSEVRLFINTEVCEGCGDCGVQSNCIAIEPVETEFGRKRRINQSVCNTDLSCLRGFCPSFVTVVGGKPRPLSGKTDLAHARDLELPDPELPEIGDGYSLLVAGIGGNGVITIGAILGMAAHMEEQAVTILDNTGFAQRNGSVMSHIRLAENADRMGSARIPPGSANLVLGCDAIVAASPDSLSMMNPSSCKAVVNSFVAPTSAFAGNPDLRIESGTLLKKISDRIGPEGTFDVDATEISSALLGNALGANMFLVGFAWQAGLVPLRREAIETAIKLNGASVQMNLDAFKLGRLAKERPDILTELMRSLPQRSPAPTSLPEIVAHRRQHLTEYQNAGLADRYEALVNAVHKAETVLDGANSRLAESVARTYAKLLAYKDEYEVARLLSKQAFKQEIARNFSGDVKLHLNLAPPILSRRDPRTGRLGKREFGSWLLPLMPLLAKLRGLRGTVWDIFGHHPHRKLERALIEEYEAEIQSLIPRLNKDNYESAIAISEAFSSIRGYDVIKEDSIKKMRAKLESAKRTFRESQPGTEGKIRLIRSN